MRTRIACFSAVQFFALMGCLLPAAFGQTAHYDLLLKGGHVIDPANHVDAVMDVAIAGGKIAAVEKNISPASAGKVVDVTGLYVTPGLIDIHYHISHGGAPLNWFTPEARVHEPPLGVPPDLALVIADSGKQRELSRGDYNLRRQQTQAAARACKAAVGG